MPFPPSVSVPHFKFASTRAQLAELTATPAFGWDHQFAAPQGMVRVLMTVDEQDDYINYDYRREVLVTRVGTKQTERDVLLTNQDDMFIRYLYARTNPAAWPGWFQRLAILHGARNLVAPSKKDDFTALNLRERFKDAYLKAKGANAAEDTNTDRQTQDIDMGNQDFVDAVYDNANFKIWDTSSENRS